MQRSGMYLSDVQCSDVEVCAVMFSSMLYQSVGCSYMPCRRHCWFAFTPRDERRPTDNMCTGSHRQQHNCTIVLHRLVMEHLDLGYTQ